MNTIENNKLIAEFMGWKDPSNFGVFCHSTLNEAKSIEEFQSHTSWDWLMPVYMRCHEVAEIEEGEVLKVFNELFYGMLVFNNINWLYDACIEFVEWYNQQSK